MIYILSWEAKSIKKFYQGHHICTFKVDENSRIFQGLAQKFMEFKDFSRTSPKIQGLFKTVRALGSISCFSCSGILYKTRTTFSFPFRQTSAIYVYPSISCLPVLACFFGRSRCFKCCVSFFIV